MALGSTALHEELVALQSEASRNDAWWHDRDQLARRLAGAPLSALHGAIRVRLRDGPGAVVVQAGPDHSPDALRLLQLVLGEALGSVLTIAPDAPGRPLFKVSAVEGQGLTGGYKGNAKNRDPIGFHTDGSGVRGRVEVLSMSCIRPALSGGASRVVDSRVVHAHLSRGALDALKLPFPRENPYRQMDADEMLVAPIFDRGNRNDFSYHPARVRNGIRLVYGELSDAVRDALDELDRRLEEFAIDILLEVGDILMLDNRRFAHDRRAFADDLLRPRLIERLWIGHE